MKCTVHCMHTLRQRNDIGVDSSAHCSVGSMCMRSKAAVPQQRPLHAAGVGSPATAAAAVATIATAAAALATTLAGAVGTWEDGQEQREKVVKASSKPLSRKNGTQGWPGSCFWSIQHNDSCF